MYELWMTIWFIGYCIELLFSMTVAWPANAHKWAECVPSDRNNTKGKLHRYGIIGSVLLGICIAFPFCALFMPDGMNRAVSGYWLLALVVYILAMFRYWSLLDRIEKELPIRSHDLADSLLRLRYLHSPFRQKSLVPRA